MTNYQANLSSLKIILWNANGLSKKEFELLNFLIENQIDKTLISEMRYTQNSKHFFPGYFIYKTNHPDGTCMELSLFLFHLKFITIFFPTFKVLLSKQKICQLQ